MDTSSINTNQPHTAISTGIRGSTNLKFNTRNQPPLIYRSTSFDDSICFGRSSNNGTTWQPASLIYDTVYTSEKWPFLMELETTGNLWCAFTTNEDTGFDGDRSIKLLRSDNGGTTWSKSSIYSNAGYSYTWPALVQTGNSVMAVWDNDGWENSEPYDTIQKSITTFSSPPPPPCDPTPCAVNSCIKCCGSAEQCGG